MENQRCYEPLVSLSSISLMDFHAFNSITDALAYI